MKNLRTSINSGLSASIAGGLILLKLLSTEANLKIITENGKFIALNR